MGMLHQLPLNDKFMINVQIIDNNDIILDDVKTISIRIDIYSPNDYDRGMIMAYLQTDGFANHFSTSLNESAQAVNIEHIGFSDAGSDTSFHSLFVVVIIVMAILFCIVLLSGAYYLHQRQKQNLLKHDKLREKFVTNSEEKRADATSDNAEWSTLNDVEQEFSEESIELFSNDSDDDMQHFILPPSTNSLLPFQTSETYTEGSAQNEVSVFAKAQDSLSSNVENDDDAKYDDDDDENVAVAANGNTLFRQISNLLMANGVNLDEFKLSDNELNVLDEEEEALSDAMNDEGVNEAKHKNGECEEDNEWNLKAMQILEQHKKKQLDQAQIKKARKLLAAKREIRGRVRKSVLNRRDLLKLNKQKLAKKCKQANLPCNGTKQEMVDRLIEKNKKKNKHKKTEHVFQ